MKRKKEKKRKQKKKSARRMTLFAPFQQPQNPAYLAHFIWLHEKPCTAKHHVYKLFSIYVP